MKLFWLLMSFAGLLSSCGGVEYKVGNGLDGLGQSVESVADSLDTALALDEVLQLSEGVGSDLPGLLFDETAAGSLAAAPPAIMAPASLADTCPIRPLSGSLPQDRICTIRSGLQNIGIYVPAAADAVSEVSLVSYHREYEHDSGVTGTIDIYDTEMTTGTIFADLMRHRVQVVRRVWGTPGMRVFRKTEIILSLAGGCLDQDRRAGYCKDVDDAPDQLFAFAVSTEFSDGKLVEEWVNPDRPTNALRIDAVTSGSYSRIVQFPEGAALLREQLSVSFDRTERSESQSRYRFYADGTSDGRTVQNNESRVEVMATHANGRRVEIAYDRNLRSLTRTIVFEAGHRWQSLFEQGSAGTGTDLLSQELTLADGTLVVREIRVERSAATTKISYLKGDLKASELEVSGRGGDRMIHALLRRDDGLRVEFSAQQDVSGGQIVNFWLDRPDISQDIVTDREQEQDAEGYLIRQNNGESRGEIQYATAEGEIAEADIQLSGKIQAQVNDRGVASRRNLSKSLENTIN